MSRPGLRERKKIETLHRMQEEALRLFADQGYEATTVEQIAEAAGVSPSTFYRYFPTKEDVVVQDEYDPMIVAVFQRQSPDVPPLAAMRATLAELFADFAPEDLERIRGRVAMIVSVPSLLARQFQQASATQRMLADLVAERYDRSPEDLEVRNFAASVVASWTTAITAWADAGGHGDLMSYMDRCIAHLEDGVPL
ncbi:TetR family transcriptional regulator [Glycomyces halotolerans]